MPEIKDSKTAVEQMQSTIDALCFHRDSALERLQSGDHSIEEAVNLCKYVVFVHSQVADLRERISLANLLEK